MKHLRRLEDQSVYILREAYKHFDNLAMLWSMGKDSTVLLWLARKAFFGHVPFPLLHVDTSYKIPAMIEYRDRLAREWHLNLVVGQNKEALAQNIVERGGGGGGSRHGSFSEKGQSIAYPERAAAEAGFRTYLLLPEAGRMGVSTLRWSGC